MRLNVGRIGRAHGILGEATIEVRTDDASSRFALGSLLETDDHGALTVESVREHNGILLLSFKDYSDRNAVEKLRDVLLYAEIDINAPGEDEDDYHVLQLIGCKAYLGDGSLVGEITDVLNLPGQNVLIIDGGSSEILIPFVRALVPEVDVAKKTVVVIPPVIDGRVQ